MSRLKESSGELDIAAILERMVDGKSVLIPAKLAKNIAKISRKSVGRDQAVIQWCWLDQMIHTRKEEKQSILDKKTEKKNPFIPIHADVFKKNLLWCNKRRLAQFKKLEELKLVACDGKWRRQTANSKGKSLGYKVINRKKLVEYELESGNYTAADIIPKITDGGPAGKVTRRNLGRLELQKKLLAPAIHDTIERRILDKYDGWENFALKKGIPESIKEETDWEKNFSEVVGLVYPVMKINLNRGRIFRDQTGRLHSPFTNLKRILRGIFEVDGEQLVGLDMQAAQPTLLALSTGDSALLEDCKKDNLYKKIMKDCKVGRDVAKKIWMAYAYGDNRSEKTTNKLALRCGKLAQKNWPVTYQELYNQKKARPYNLVAREMMQKEAKLFIDGVLMGLNKKNIFALTVHDGVYVKKSDQAQAMEVATALLTDGITRMFSVEDTPILALEKTRPKWLVETYDLAPGLIV